MLDREQQRELNQKFSLEPEAGNYWSEMCVPIALVLDVDEETVTYCGRKDAGENHWTFAVDQPKTVTRE